MPGIIGFPQLDPGYGFGGSPPAEEQEPATKPPQMPMQPDPALEEYDSRQEERIKHLDTIRPIKPPNSGQDKSNNGDGTRNGKSTYTVAEQIRIRNQERAEQDAAAAQRRRQTISRLPSDIDEESRAGEYDSRTPLEILTQPGEENVRVQEGTYSVLTGTRFEDEEQDIVEELTRILKTIAPLGLFEDEPWYTTRLGPAQSSAVAPFPSSYGNITFPDLISNLDPVGQGGIDTNDKRASSETAERWYRGSETELHPHLRHALAQTYSGGSMGKWNEEWTQLEDLEAFLKDRLAPFFPKDFIDNRIQWGRLTGFGMIHMHRSLMEALWNEHWSVDSALNPWISSLNEEFADADDLLSAVSANPLVNEARLIEEFSYASIEEARDDFLAQVQYAYEKFDIQPPEDLHEWSALELANEFYSLLTNVFEPYAQEGEGSEKYQKALDFLHDPDFLTIVGKAPSTTIDRLDGSHQTSPMELVFFVASFFNEPLDWALTIRDIVSAAEDGDLRQAILLGLIGLAPGALGRFVKRGKAHELLTSNELLEANELLDEAVDAAWVNSKVAAPKQSYRLPGSDYVPRVRLEDFKPGVSNNAKQLRREAENARVNAPDEFPSIIATGTDNIQMHHTVPSGEPWSPNARRILLDKRIHPNSAYNAVALTRHVHIRVVHGLGNRKRYAEALDNALLRIENDTQEQIIEFLLETGRRLHGLNSLPENSRELAQAFEEIVNWVNTYAS